MTRKEYNVPISSQPLDETMSSRVTMFGCLSRFRKVISRKAKTGNCI